jgi:C4-dicarboxylate-specific signal transduction histidine kinase
MKEADAKKLSRLVMVEIQDNGPGMDPETLKQAFTPFFTTKNTGSGLGLVIAQRIIQEHGGTLRFKSVKGKGTNIQILLRSVL